MQRDGKANGAEFPAHPNSLLLLAGGEMDVVSLQLMHPKGTGSTFSYAGGIFPGWHRAGPGTRRSLRSLPSKPALILWIAPWRGWMAQTSSSPTLSAPGVGAIWLLLLLLTGSDFMGLFIICSKCLLWVQWHDPWGQTHRGYTSTAPPSPQ